MNVYLKTTGSNINKIKNNKNVIIENNTINMLLPIEK